MEKSQKEVGQKRTSMGEIQKHIMEKTKMVDCKDKGRKTKKTRFPPNHKSRKGCVKKCSSKLVTFFSQPFHLPSLYLVTLPVSGEGSSTSPG